MYKAIREATDIVSIRVVVFTRGESTLYLDQLVEGVSLADKYGFVARLVTNAWWASSVERAREYLGRLREAGLRELNISFDRFRAPFLAKYGGFQNVMYAASVAVELGITVLIGITKLRDEEGLDVKWAKERLKEAGLEGVMVIQDVPSRLGRAADLPEEIFPEDDVPKEVGCPEAMRTIVLHPNGNVTLCCGHIVTLPEAAWLVTVGNLNRESLVEIIAKMRRNALAISLRYAGPLKLLRATGEENPPKFYSACEVCYHIATQKSEELNKLTAEPLLGAVFGDAWRGMLLRTTPGSP